MHRESHFVTQRAQSTFCALSVRDSLKKLPVRRMEILYIIEYYFVPL